MSQEINTEKIYIAITIQSTDEAMVGLLWQYDFESFQEEDDYVIGYYPSDMLNDGVKSEIVEIIERFTPGYTFELIPYQNWNEIWESSFQPVVIGEFCQVRADFHPINTNILYDIIINPKMAFGTGHHATTYMMIESMSTLDWDGRAVFDFGCGTGILAILASKLGAQKIVAIDIEKESYLNTIENAQINHVDNIETYCSEIERFAAEKFDIIVANINKNILLAYKDVLYKQLEEGGQLLLSGILQDDVEKVITDFEKQGFEKIAIRMKEDWACVHFSK